MAQMKPNSKLQFKVVKKYTEDYTGNHIDGDVFIVQHDDKIGDAGVYSDGQIVHLEKTSVIYTYACKVNVDTFTGGKTYAIFRKKKGVPLSFKENVIEAMSRSAENEYSTHNCIEFVMELFDINLKPTIADCGIIARGSKPKGFKVVKNFSDDYVGNAKLGDLFIVPCSLFGLQFRVGVCCREQGPEIISLTGGPLQSGTMKKVHVSGFPRGKEYAVYRRKTGIPNSFQELVDEAMTKNSGLGGVQLVMELICGNLENTTQTMEKQWTELSGDNYL